MPHPSGRRMVMVIGGYGAVGSLISRRLATEPGVAVVVAGRRLEAAAGLAAEIGSSARHLDLDDFWSWKAATWGIDCVVMCMDQHDTRFVEFLFSRGIHYVDITANDRFFLAVEQLKSERSAAMLSVGLAPGLTNLLAAHGAARVRNPIEVEIGLLFGLGDSHGEAALEWMADQLFDPDRPAGGASLDFGFGLGRRMAHVVDFSDQRSLMRTLPAGLATTRVAFESRLATSGLFLLAERFAGSRAARRVTLAAFRRFRTGSRLCAASVHVRGQGAKGEVLASAHFVGEVESETTAGLATIQIAKFLARPPAPGVWHSDEILDPEEVFREVTARAVGRIAIEPLTAGSAVQAA